MVKDEKCPFCDKLFSKMGLGSHVWRVHGEGVSHIPNQNAVNVPCGWNKGLSKESNELVAKQSASAKASLKRRIQVRDNVQNWRNRLKERLIEEKGGACVLCGYNKCLRSLHFHHLDPESKSFSLSEMRSNPQSLEKIRKELEKCVLVCSNCHGEIHEGLHSELEILVHQ